MTTDSQANLHQRAHPPWRATALIAALSVLGVACTTSVQLTSEDGDGLVERSPAPQATPIAEATTPPQLPTVTPEPTPTPLIPGLLTVNDTDAVGVVGDEFLSLVEAVRLANGLLTKAELSAGESVLVVGDPGPALADTINVDLGPGTEILLPGANAWIVELFGNDGDMLNGGGAVLTGAIQGDGIGHNAMLIGSENVAINQFSFVNVTSAIGIESAGRALDGISIENNAFVNVAVRDIALQNSVDEGALTNVTIAGNTFDAPQRQTDFHTFITVRGASALEGQTTTGTSITDLEIRNNSMTAGPGATETCISVAAGYVEFAIPGNVTRASVERLVIAENRLSGCTTGIALTGGLVNQTNGGAADSVVRAVDILDNTVTVAGTGLDIHGGFVKPVPDAFEFTTPVDAQLTGNRVEEVHLGSNVWSAIDTVIKIVGGEFAVPGTGEAQANSVDTITSTQAVIDDVGSFCDEAADRGPLASGNILTASCAELDPT